MKTSLKHLKTPLFSLFVMTLAYASGLFGESPLIPQPNYYAMELTQLQHEVEKRSQRGDLPFEMGLALMQKWTNQ